MPSQCPHKSFNAFVRQSKFVGCLFCSVCDLPGSAHDRCWETSGVQSENSSLPHTMRPPAAIAKVGGRQRLMYCPVILKTAVFIKHRIGCSFDYVCRLENNSENKPGKIMHDKDANQDLPPCERRYQQRNYKDVGHIKTLVAIRITHSLLMLASWFLGHSIFCDSGLS